MASSHFNPTIDLNPAKGSPDEATGPPSDSSEALVVALDQYLADLQAGKAPDRARLVAEHPELATKLEACLAGTDFVHRATPGHSWLACSAGAGSELE